MSNIKYQILNVQKGFTLVESLVAISILMIAIASPMILAQKGLSTATLSKDQMIASFLVQDAIEAVKNFRDQIAVSQTSVDWLVGNGAEFFVNCICDSEDTCNFDSSSLKFCNIDTTFSTWNQNSITVGSQTSLIPLKISYFDSKFLKYDYIGSTDSKFFRYINIKRTSNPDEALLSVRVSWNSPQGIQKIDIQNFIYNYSGNL
ncbi:MAG: type II secretion system protein [bacterium]